MGDAMEDEEARIVRAEEGGPLTLQWPNGQLAVPVARDLMEFLVEEMNEARTVRAERDTLRAEYATIVVLRARMEAAETERDALRARVESQRRAYQQEYETFQPLLDEARAEAAALRSRVAELETGLQRALRYLPDEELHRPEARAEVADLAALLTPAEPQP